MSKLVLYAISLLYFIVIALFSALFAFVFSNSFLGVFAAACLISAVISGVLIYKEGHKKRSEQEF
jgi:hypothetical protein